jgi:hypothetical protein
MRADAVAVALLLAGLFPNLGNAQVYHYRTPPPPVTAQYEAWQFNNEPIMVAGLVYYATRESRFFDPEIMTQIGVYRSVPVYADVTLEPWSVIYVPVGRQIMRGYERKREGELAGTQGSRVPAFPVDIPSSIAPWDDRTAVSPAEVGTVGSTIPPAAHEHHDYSRVSSAAAPAPPPATPPEPMHVVSIPAPQSNDGVWLEFEGTRWYAQGRAATFDDIRFVRIGDYHGFPVFRERNGPADEIWVRVVPDGPVAPYRRR